MNRCELDGRAVESMSSFYDEIARQLSFPTYFGRNLDALWDVLTADIEGPIEIIWTCFQRPSEFGEFVDGVDEQSLQQSIDFS